MGKLVVLLISVLTIFTSPCGESPNGITVSPSPSPTSAAIEATAEPQEEQTEEYDEGYGGFLEPTHNEDNKNVHAFTFSIACHNALSSDKLSDELRALLPSDGFIAPVSEYNLTEGMTVYDALKAALSKYGFAADYKSGYVSGIGGLYEFDCGGSSGWMYTVNGEVTMAPINMYKIKDGDVVQIAYTVSLGSDLGHEVN